MLQKKEAVAMQQEFITVTFNRTKIAIRRADILYVIMSDDHCTIHIFDGSVYRCRMTLKELRRQLNEEFMEVKRGCMVAVSAISAIGDKILLSNGEEICYTKRKKKALREDLQKKQKLMIAKISKKKLPLDKMIGSSFSSLFSNMDSKWLQSYERATLYGETLEIMDYSPEIDTNLKIICFPTFPGHCGCILFNADKMKTISEENHLVRLAAVSMKGNPTI